MLGGGPYEATTCPECGSTMWNGRCENLTGYPIEW